MGSSANRCAVTGANGYVGSRIAEYFEARDWTVFAFTRRHNLSASSSQVHVPFQLESRIDPQIFRENDIRAVIHCAYDFRPVDWKEIYRVNVEGSTRLFRAAKEAGVDRIIFMSSISAFDGCSSLYGKAKLEIEKVAARVGASIIRSGLVYGSRPSGGMFGALQRSVAKSTIIPLIGSGKYIQYLVHEEDLCGLILRLIQDEENLPLGPVVAASPYGWRIRDLVQVMATAQHTRVRLVPLPWQAIWLVLKVGELLGIGLPFRSDSVISLVRQNPNPDFSLADQLGYRFRGFDGGLVSAPSVRLAQTPNSDT